MKSRRFVMIAVMLIVGMGVANSDDACVQKTISEYKEGFREFQAQFLVLADVLRLTAQKNETRDMQAVPKQENQIQTLPAFAPQENVGTGVGGELHPVPFEGTGEVIDLVGYETNCEFPPYKIIKDSPYILDYPTPLPAYCGYNSYNVFSSSKHQASHSAPSLLPSLNKVITFSRSVGRLKLRSTDDSGQEQVEMWGTGFMIGDKIFATSCHVIAPLLNKDQKLKLDADEKLVINFTASDVPANDQDDFDINEQQQVWCSQHEGLDIALLEVVPANRQLPPALPLFYGTVNDFKAAVERQHLPKEETFWRIGALIGYGDLLHPIDETTREMYEPYEKYNNYQYSDVKVAMLDGIVTKDECDDGELEVILDTADTTVGESGAIVMDSLRWITPESPAFVLGVHTCCSAYFGTEKYSTPRVEPACARIKRTFHNQDISSWSILNDSNLCPILEKSKGKVIDADGTQSYVSCSHLKR